MQTAPLAVSIVDAARLAGVGRSTLYSAVQDGALPMRKCGRRSLIFISDIEAWLANLPASKPSQAAA